MFREIVMTVGEQIQFSASTKSVEATGDTAFERLESTTRRYLEVYKKEAKILGLMEQVSAIDEEVHNMRLSGRQRHIDRVAGEIERLQEYGVTDPDLAPAETAAALVSMLSSAAFWMYAAGDMRNEELAVRSLTRIWAQTLGLYPPDRRLGPDRTVDETALPITD